MPGIPRCVLVGAKTKAAPLKPLSIPRLKLQEAMIGSRLLNVNSICTSLSLPIKKRYLWSDSTSDSRLATLRQPAFRVGDILSTTKVSEWRYVPSKQNVADEATKWGTGPSFSQESSWFRGPPFFHLSEEQWPTVMKYQQATDEELRAVYSYQQIIQSPLVNTERFSKWCRLLITTAYVLRAVKLFRRQKQAGALTGEELFEAENLLWRQAQAVNRDELSTLYHNKLNADGEPRRINKSSPLYKLSPFIDDHGVLRMCSRIRAAPTFAAKISSSATEKQSCNNTTHQ